jgi:hypothetical protein
MESPPEPRPLPLDLEKQAKRAITEQKVIRKILGHLEKRKADSRAPPQH